MKRAVLLGVISMAAGGTAAKAEPFVGLGLGTNGYSDAHQILNTDGRTARLFGGYRFPGLQIGSLAVEAGLEGYGLIANHGTDEYDGRELYIASKYSYPFAEGFEAFARLGAQRTSVSGGSNNTSASALDVNGSGYLYGLGLEYRLNLTVVTGSIFLDWTRTTFTLQGDRAMDSTVDRWMMGFTVGL
jgi:hypothetical protein